MKRRATVRDLRGPGLFIASTMLLTWGSAALCARGFDAGGVDSSTLLRASLIYAAVVGWQPLVGRWLARRLVDDQRTLDRGQRAITAQFSALAIVAPLALLAAAAACELWISGARGASASGLRPHGLGPLWSSVITFVGVVAVLWLQAIAEELAWRGYLLPRLMRSFRAWPGLLVHGCLWGMCYAPVFLIGQGAQPLRIASFVVTCGLLGILLGWLRLASRSIYASAASNATLTICAGLPLILQGSSSYFAAVFEPIGWLPMLALIALIVARSSWRAAIAVPERGLPEHVN